jgi:hypothetical protein
MRYLLVERMGVEGWKMQVFRSRHSRNSVHGSAYLHAGKKPQKSG